MVSAPKTPARKAWIRSFIPAPPLELLRAGRARETAATPGGVGPGGADGSLADETVRRPHLELLATLRAGVDTHRAKLEVLLDRQLEATP